MSENLTILVTVGEIPSGNWRHFSVIYNEFNKFSRRDTQWELATKFFLSFPVADPYVDEIPNGNWRLHRRLQHLTPEVGEIPNGNGNFWFFMTYLLFLSISRRNTAMGVGRDVYDFPGVVLRIGLSDF